MWLRISAETGDFDGWHSEAVNQLGTDALLFDSHPYFITVTGYDPNSEYRVVNGSRVWHISQFNGVAEHEQLFEGVLLMGAFYMLPISKDISVNVVGLDRNGDMVYTINGDYEIEPFSMEGISLYSKYVKWVIERSKDFYFVFVDDSIPDGGNDEWTSEQSE